MQEHRYRISTVFNYHKVGLSLMALLIFLSLVRAIWVGDFSVQEHMFMVIILLLLTGMVIGLFLYPVQIHYDDVQQVLYRVNTRKRTEEPIPVERITAVVLSSVGRGNYRISYVDQEGNDKSFLLFTIPLDDSIETVIRDAQYVNPGLKVQRWRIG